MFSKALPNKEGSTFIISSLLVYTKEDRTLSNSALPYIEFHFQRFGDLFYKS